MLYRNSVTIILMLLLSICFISCEYANTREILTAMSTEPADTADPIEMETPVEMEPEVPTETPETTEPDETTEPETEPPFVLVHRYIDGIKKEQTIIVYNTLQGFLESERYQTLLAEVREYNEKYCGQSSKPSIAERIQSVPTTSEELANEIKDYMLTNHSDDVKIFRSTFFTDHNDPENWWLVVFRARCG